jgi:hypothetical protein
MEKENDLMAKIVSLSKRRGFIFWPFCLSETKMQNGYSPKFMQ